MKRNMTFCETCRKDTAYYVEVVELKNKLKEEAYSYSGKKAICSECGAEVYASEIENENLKNLYDIYRKRNNIIAYETILEIPTKYNIGKRPLSLLLNWGEMTFSRYCEGDMPTKQYADMLLKIYNEPDYYVSLLEQNRDNITPVAYEKSKRAALTLLGREVKQNLKVDHVIGYILFRCEDITPLALQKALYYVQGLYYAFMGEYLFNDDCEAWIHGPVYKDIYNRYSGYHFDPIECEKDFNISKLLDSEKAVIDSVVQYLCCYSGKILESFTHAEIPWIQTRGDLPADAHSNRVIAKDLIGGYFTAVKEKYNMLIPNDIESYAKIMFDRTTKFPNFK